MPRASCYGQLEAGCPALAASLSVTGPLQGRPLAHPRACELCGLLVTSLHTGSRLALAITPLATAHHHYRDRHGASRKKPDPVDALVLANNPRTQL